MGARSLVRSLGGHWRLRAEAETVSGPEGGQSGVILTLSREVTSSGVGCCYKQSGLESGEREVARMRVLEKHYYQFYCCVPVLSCLNLSLS